MREQIEHQRSRKHMTTEQVLCERLNNETIAATFRTLQTAGQHNEALLYMGEEILAESLFYNGHDIDEVREAMRCER